MMSNEVEKLKYSVESSGDSRKFQDIYTSVVVALWLCGILLLLYTSCGEKGRSQVVPRPTNRPTVFAPTSRIPGTTGLIGNNNSRNNSCTLTWMWISSVMYVCLADSIGHLGHDSTPQKVVLVQDLYQNAGDADEHGAPQPVTINPKVLVFDLENSEIPRVVPSCCYCNIPHYYRRRAATAASIAHIPYTTSPCSRPPTAPTPVSTFILRLFWFYCGTRPQLSSPPRSPSFFGGTPSLRGTEL